MAKKLRYALLVLPFAIMACHKHNNSVPDNSNNPPPAATRNFKYFPKSNARWRMHLQGNMDVGAGGYYFDSSYHFYVDINAINRDTVISGNTYSIYHSKIVGYKAGALLTQADSTIIWVREDTATGKTYMMETYSNVFVPERNLLHYPLNAGDTVEYWGMRGEGVLQPQKTLILGGAVFKYWEVKEIHSGNVMFYQAEGVGGQSGPVDLGFPYGGNGPVVRSLTFTYAGDSVQFDFPLVY